MRQSHSPAPFINTAVNFALTLDKSAVPQPVGLVPGRLAGYQSRTGTVAWYSRVVAVITAHLTKIPWRSARSGNPNINSLKRQTLDRRLSGWYNSAFAPTDAGSRAGFLEF